jgi:subtilisin family serine protease
MSPSRASHEKISPAFEPFLDESGPNDKRSAIVIYEVPEPTEKPETDRVSEHRARLEYVESRAALQKPIEEHIFESYLEAGRKQLRGNGDLDVSAIGSSSLPVATVEVTRRTLPELTKQPEVIAVLPNQRIRLVEPREIDYSGLYKRQRDRGVTWGLNKLGIPDLWETTKGEGINVAVLDTGVHGDHPALTDRIQDFVMIDPLGRRIMPDRTFDGGKHGTHVCGTIAGSQSNDGVSIGVAPAARLLVAGVLVGESTLRTLMEGISWAVEKGADIINMSLGFAYYEPLFAEVLDILIGQFGILPVVAIGNDSHGNSCSPGNVYSAFSVGAVEKARYGRIEVAFYSSGASLVFPGQEPNALVTKPDVVAPGSHIYSSIPPENRPDGTYEYTFMSGTSMAAPHVAGIAALLMAAQRNAPIPAIIQALKETADHPAGSTKRPDNRWGHGLVQPVEALKALRS